MQRSASTTKGAFTVVELLVAGLISGAVGIAIFGFLNSGLFLAAKNLSVNLTSNQIRGTLDRIEQILQQGDNNPTLIDTTGAAVASGTSAGVKVDRFLGGPYVMTPSGTGLLAAATTLTLVRSTNALASPPIPAAGDVVRIDGTAATLRPMVASVVVSAPDASLHQQIVATLTAPLGTAVPVGASGMLTAKLVRNAAFIVMTNGPRREMRYYSGFECVNNLSTPANYTVITDQMGLQTADATPFSLVQMGGKNFVSLGLNVRAGNYDNRLMNKQIDQFNSYAWVQSYIRPKANP